MCCSRMSVKGRLVRKAILIGTGSLLLQGSSHTGVEGGAGSGLRQ